MENHERMPRVRKGMATQRETERSVDRDAGKDAEAIAAAIQEHLVRPQEALRGWRSEPVRLVESRHRTTSRAAFTFVAPLVNEATGERQDRTVVAVSYGGNRTRRAWERLKRPSGMAGGMAVAPPLLRAGYDPGLDLLLQSFPFDNRLPALQVLLAGPNAAVLEALGAPAQAAWSVEVVRYHPDMRAMLAVSAGDRRGFVKLYRDEEKGAEATAVHAAIRAGMARHSGVEIPEVLGWLPELRAQVLAPAVGEELQTALALAGGGAPEIAGRAARAIAGFHQLPLDPAWSRPPDQESLRVDRLAADLMERFPALSERVVRVSTALDEALPLGPVGTSHGDLKPEHVLVAGERVALIDFDRVAVGDPLQDVANLAHQLARRLGREAGGGTPYPAAVGALLDAYAAAMPEEWARHLPARLARAAFGKAAVAIRGGDATEGWAEAGLREAEDALAGRLWSAEPGAVAEPAMIEDSTRAARVARGRSRGRGRAAR
ncbi:MAG: aminoglycoside phosphotransferase family protein [Chloroflexota bacterium]